MPWEDRSIMDQRIEFVALASAPGANLSRLCRRFGVSRPTAYKWLARAADQGGPSALADRSRRPHASPTRVDHSVEDAVLAVRDTHPAWGGRKIRAWMQRHGAVRPPAASTITAILQRHGRIDPAESAKRGPMTRFEDERPNGTWQMDFKGHLPMRRGGRCHPLTVLDDHSRYCVALRSCVNETEGTVRTELVAAFERYGMPDRILCDNGSPWGSGATREWTALEVWLLERGVAVAHGRPYHPQTQGKDERFHRTLKAELLCRVDLLDQRHAQSVFDPWRTMYNTQRPHEALGMVPPGERYRPGSRCFDPRKVDPGYGPGEVLRKTDEYGRFRYRGRGWRVGKAFKGRVLALRAAGMGSELSVCLGPYEIGRIDPAGRGEGGEDGIFPAWASARCARRGPSRETGD